MLNHIHLTDALLEPKGEKKQRVKNPRLSTNFRFDLLLFRIKRWRVHQTLHSERKLSSTSGEDILSNHRVFFSPSPRFPSTAGKREALDIAHTCFLRVSPRGGKRRSEGVAKRRVRGRAESRGEAEEGVINR